MKSISHATSAKAATNNHFPSFPSSQNQISNTKNQKSLPSLPWRPLRESIHKPHATSAKAATYSSKLHLNFLTFLHSHVRTPSRPWRPLRESIHKPHPAAAGSATFAKDFSDQKNNPFRPLRESSAFSLTEVVIAMGVAAVAFTSIIALFPLGLNMSKESYEATQAALISQTILADLKDALNGGSGIKLIQKGGEANVFTSSNYTSINLNGNTSTTYYLAFDQQPRTDSAGSPIIIRPYIFSSSLPSWYTDGTNTATMIVRVTIEKTYVLGAASASNPQKVEVSVESPGNAKATNRIQRVFPGVINQS